MVTHMVGISRDRELAAMKDPAQAVLLIGCIFVERYGQMALWL